MNCILFFTFYSSQFLFCQWSSMTFDFFGKQTNTFDHFNSRNTKKNLTGYIIYKYQKYKHVKKKGSIIYNSKEPKITLQFTNTRFI